MDSRLGAALLALADAIGSAATLDDMYSAALAGLRDVTGLDRASIQLFGADGVMRFKAWSGISDRYRAAVEGHTPWTRGQPVPEPIVVEDVAVDPLVAAYRTALADERIASLGFIPIVSRRQLSGKFMLYRGDAGPFDPAVLTTALIIGHQIGFAIERMDTLQQEALVRERLTVLTRGSQQLLTMLDAETILQRVIALAEQVVPADSYAVWRRQGDIWRVEASRNLSDEFIAMPLHGDTTIAFDEPIIAEDAQTPLMLEGRRAAYTREGIQSLMSIPLRIRDEPAGSIVFYYRTRHLPTETELRVASALGHLSAAAISNAQLYAAQQELRREAQLAETRAVFLAEASVLLSSLDYGDNLRRLAELAVPSLGDWCAVDLFEDSGVARLAVAHTDPEKVKFAHEIYQRYPPDLNEPGGMGELKRSGEPLLYPIVTDEMLVAAARDAEHLEMLRTLRIDSAMVVPLMVTGKVFGAISFVSSTPNRHYTKSDLAFATELGRRAALAIENARLYGEVNEANRVKDEFLATLSHELRTPLNVIVGRARMLVERSGHADTVQQSADTIERNAHALARLVDDLLDVSRFSAGQLTLDIQPVDIAAVVSTVVASLEPTGRAKGVTIAVAPSPALPELLGDSTRLQQVVWNLLSNAIKFTPSGGTVSLALAHTPAHVTLTVSDTGEGIEPDFLPHVFETFRQAEPTLNRRHGGLGLGLSIVRRLVELHGGYVTADSAGRGQGATFRVALPAAAAGAGS